MNKALENAYSNSANEAARRILAYSANHPEVFEVDSPFDLLKCEGLDLSDLGLTRFQAGWALNRAFYSRPCPHAKKCPAPEGECILGESDLAKCGTYNPFNDGAENA